MLKFKIEKLEDIAENLRAFYKPAPDGDGFVLQVEGVAPIERLNEFRDNNVQLKKDIDALKATFNGIDAEEYKRLKAIEDALKTGKIKGTDAEKILEERTQEMQKAHTKALDDLKASNTALNSRLEVLLINDSAVGAALEKGLRATAKDDLAARARNTFRLVDGKVVAMNGDKEIFGAQGQPLTITEWIDGQIQAAPHLFEASNGTGGKGNAKAPGNTAVNPWKKETFNLTEQGRIQRADPAQADKLRKEAGQ